MTRPNLAKWANIHEHYSRVYCDGNLGFIVALCCGHLLLREEIFVDVI